MRQLAAFVVLTLAVARGSAQTVLGVVQEQAGGPVRGAFVTLIDASGARRGSALTDQAGRFAIRPPPGIYRLTAERIGYQTSTSDSFNLLASQTHTQAITMTVAALRLPEVSVSAENRCESNPQRSAQTARVWEEIRKALTVTAWLQETGAQFRVRNFQQDLSDKLQPASTERMTFEQLQGRHAFGAESAAQLSELGFVRQNNGQVDFFGPDAELLISPEFLAQHCFWLQRSAQRPGLLGLAFQPVRNRRQSDIRGTLWIEESSHALRFVEYNFMNLGFALDARYAHGRTEFQLLPNGAWVVSKWEMNLPTLTVEGRRSTVTAAHRQGGEVLDIVFEDTTSVQLVPRFPVAGLVWDSLRSQPLAGARVFLAGTALQTQTSSQGAFQFDSVPRGVYYIGAQHARIDSIPADAPLLRVQVDSASRPVRLATPGATALLARLCNPQELNKRAVAQKVVPARLGVVVIEVQHPQSGAPLNDVDVRLLTGNELSGSGDLAADAHAVITATNARGTVTVCGVDSARPFSISLGRRPAQQFGPFLLPPERALRLVLRYAPDAQR